MEGAKTSLVNVLPRHRLAALVDSRFLCQAICVANRKKIADIVSSNCQIHISKVAEQLDCHESNLLRLMGFMAAHGIFEEKEGHRFVGNQVSDAMREDINGNCHQDLLFLGSQAQWLSVKSMSEALGKYKEPAGDFVNKYFSPKPLEATSPRNKLLNLVHARILAQSLFVANDRKIANIVTSSCPVHVCQLAEILNLNEENLYKMMSYLAAHGIFEEQEGRKFIGNAMSDALREDLPGNAYHTLLHISYKPYWDVILNMEMVLDKASSQKTLFERLYGETFYNYLSNRPDEQRTFDLGVQSQTSAWQESVPVHYDFSRFNTVVDLAGGRGTMLKAILNKCPNIQGTLFETSAMMKNIHPDLMSDEQLKSRLHLVEGDLLAPINCVADIFSIAMTLHCFDDERLVVILQNIAAAMRRKPGSRLLILEFDCDKAIVPNSPHGARQMDIRMMLLFGGRERDMPGWKAILSQQGFKITGKVIFPPNFMGLECELA